MKSSINWFRFTPEIIRGFWRNSAPLINKSGASIENYGLLEKLLALGIWKYSSVHPWENYEKERSSI